MKLQNYIFILLIFSSPFLNAQNKKKIKSHKATTNKTIPKIVDNYDDYESIYVTTGDLGCANVTPRYDYSLDTGLLVKNHGDLDLVLKLINMEDNICSRMVYIQKNSTLNIKNIPQGKYIIKEAHGQDWKQKISDNKCIGVFATDAFYRQSKNIPKFYVTKTTDETGETTSIPSYELELGIRIIRKPGEKNNSNYHTNTISSSEFNN